MGFTFGDGTGLIVGIHMVINVCIILLGRLYGVHPWYEARVVALHSLGSVNAI